MSFETDGFFSPEIETFRRMARETQPFKEWFDYALGLNRLGFDMLRRAKRTESGPSAVSRFHPEPSKAVLRQV
jgi:hypothetical protein